MSRHSLCGDFCSTLFISDLGRIKCYWLIRLVKKGVKKRSCGIINVEFRKIIVNLQFDIYVSGAASVKEDDNEGYHQH